MNNVATDLHASAENPERALGMDLTDRFHPGDWLSAPGDENALAGPLSIPQQRDALGLELGNHHFLHKTIMTWSYD
jgi:hypothetical protein